jgi:hypothetical protein
MTNAVDVLCVGGPANGRMYCLNRNAEGFPPKLDITSIDDPAGVITYIPRKWWNSTNERWYWIATWDGYAPTEDEIHWQITYDYFQPAWDLRDLPPPIIEEET